MIRDILSFGSILAGGILCAVGLLGSAPRAYSSSTIGVVDKFSYSGNGGWMNLRGDGASGLVVGEYFLSGYGWAANLGWIDFGSGNPGPAVRYGNSSEGNFGVNHEGGGLLDGFAYGSNVGWIRFGGGSVAPENAPRIDLRTGEFSGFAYGANIGWIDLGTGLMTIEISVPDLDEDGISDWWEMDIFNSLAIANETSNHDKDPDTDREEYERGTDPKDPTEFFRMVGIEVETQADEALVTFTSNSRRIYQLETSTRLGEEPSPWMDSGLGVFLADPGTTTTRVLSPLSQPMRFYRAVVLQPLSGLSP